MSGYFFASGISGHFFPVSGISGHFFPMSGNSGQIFFRSGISGQFPDNCHPKNVTEPQPASSYIYSWILLPPQTDRIYAWPYLCLSHWPDACTTHSPTSACFQHFIYLDSVFLLVRSRSSEYGQQLWNSKAHQFYKTKRQLPHLLSIVKWKNT